MNEPNISRRWIYNLENRVVNGKRLSWSVERILTEAKRIEFKEHPNSYREWMGKQLPFKP